MIVFRAVERSENPGVPVSFGGHNLPPCPPVEIGLTDLAKTGDDRPDIEALEIEKMIRLLFWSCTKYVFD